MGQELDGKIGWEGNFLSPPLPGVLRIVLCMGCPLILETTHKLGDETPILQMQKLSLREESDECKLT